MTKPTARLRVLLVEDEESFIDALTIGLDREGFDVTVCADGQSAIDTFAPDSFEDRKGTRLNSSH